VPNNPALWAVFLGHHTGLAIVDDLQHPQQCLLRTEALLTYASRGISRDFLVKGLEHLRQRGSIWLVRSPGDPLAPAGFKVQPRLEFYNYDRTSSELKVIREKLPDQYVLRKIDMGLLQRCAWRDEMAFYCGSLENFLRYGFGICLMDEEKIVVEAYASALGSPYAEIGAITHEPYRNRGYASITVAYLLEALEIRGYHGYWSCDVDNLASAKIARKLGFRTERVYEIWVYEART